MVYSMLNIVFLPTFETHVILRHKSRDMKVDIDSDEASIDSDNTPYIIRLVIH